MKYYYVTYQWDMHPEHGYGDFVISREDFYVKAFKDAVSDLSGRPANKMHINVIEITKEEFTNNKIEFDSK